MLDGNSRLNLATFVTTWMEPQAGVADGGVPGQEHDRQGRVPAHRRAGAALCGDARRPVARPRPVGRHGLFHHRVERGLHARRDGPQAALDAGRPAEPSTGPLSGRPPGPIWSWASTSRSAGRSSATSGRSRRARSRWRATASIWTRRPPPSCATRTPSASSAILGSTFDGSYEPVAELCAALDELQERTGLDIPVHVDGASGAMIAPVPRPGPGLGLPAAAGRLHQHLGAQVRPGLPGRRLGAVARRRTRCPRSWSSASTTWAATCRPSR